MFSVQRFEPDASPIVDEKAALEALKARVAARKAKAAAALTPSSVSSTSRRSGSGSPSVQSLSRKRRHDTQHEGDGSSGSSNSIRLLSLQATPSKNEEEEEEEREQEEDGEEEPVLRPLEMPKSAVMAGGADSSSQSQKASATTTHVPAWIAAPTRVKVSVGAAHHGSVSSVGLCDALESRLAAIGVTSLFPIQAAAIPAIIEGYKQTHHPGDLCVSAATGSGKTLTYVLPILHCLRTRRVRRLRALVIQPTRELVGQCKRVFDQLLLLGSTNAGSGGGGGGGGPRQSLTTGQPLTVLACSGRLSFKREQALLVAADGSSRADVLVTTPGRLVDHIRATPGFTLQHCRFVVVDEADRLLAQSYQDWLSVLQGALYDTTIGRNGINGSSSSSSSISSSSSKNSAGKERNDKEATMMNTSQDLPGSGYGGGYGGGSTTRRMGQREANTTTSSCFAMLPAVTHRPSDGYALTAASRGQCRGNDVQKILLSATLSHDAEQLAALRLVHPRLFSASLQGKEKKTLLFHLFVHSFFMCVCSAYLFV